MLKSWLSYSAAKPCPYKFTLINVTENKIPDQALKSFVSNKLIEAYRNIEFIKFLFIDKPEDDLRAYIANYVFTSNDNQISKNVRQGDFGEVLASLIINYFGGLNVPISKLRWKFNKEKSVFCTDLIAHNQGDAISEIYYFEIKTRLSVKKEEGSKGIYNYITINAHNSLYKDMQAPHDGIADFLSRFFFEANDFEKAKIFSDLVLNPDKYKKNYELFFIIEKQHFLDDILNDLEKLPPSLDPLNVTVVLIENLKSLVEETQNLAIDEAIKLVYGK